MKKFQLKLWLETPGDEVKYNALVEALNEAMDVWKHKGLTFIQVDESPFEVSAWEFGGENGEEFDSHELTEDEQRDWEAGL